MAYSSFTVSDLTGKLGLSYGRAADLFAGRAEASPSPYLTTVLAEHIPLGTALSAREKARSEFLIAPVLTEVRLQARQRGHAVSLFSGVDLNIDRARGLDGEVDFVLSGSGQQDVPEAPVLVVVEAKDDDFLAGTGQCAAAMIGAQSFNARAGRAVPAVFGVVTNGLNWSFLRLEGSAIVRDETDYPFVGVAKILGILVGMLETAAEPATATAA